jgi:hypothetical protein
MRDEKRPANHELIGSVWVRIEPVDYRATGTRNGPHFVFEDSPRVIERAFAAKALESFHRVGLPHLLQK